LGVSKNSAKLGHTETLV